VDWLAKTGGAGKGEHRQTPQKLQQTAQITIAVGASLTIDKSWLENAAAQLQVAAGAEQLLFCAGKTASQLPVKGVKRVALGYGRR
jgi:hypothetical protein